MARYKAEELFPVVDEEGNVVGSATRVECHSGIKLLHPVVHLHVFDGIGRLLLQKRALTKDIQPGKWDTSVGGHVDFGETIEAALLREAAEELGIDARKHDPLYNYIFESDVERELVSTFKCVAEAQDIRIAHDEIEEWRFFEFEEIERLIEEGLTTPNFNLEFDRLKTILLEQNTKNHCFAK